MEPGFFAAAKTCVGDSLAQCSRYRDSCYALGERMIQPEKLIELGRMIEDGELGRRNEEDIIIADLARKRLGADRGIHSAGMAKGRSSTDVLI